MKDLIDAVAQTLPVDDPATVEPPPSSDAPVPDPADATPAAKPAGRSAFGAAIAVKDRQPRSLALYGGGIAVSCSKDALDADSIAFEGALSELRISDTLREALSLDASPSLIALLSPDSSPVLIEANTTLVYESADRAPSYTTMARALGLNPIAQPDEDE